MPITLIENKNCKKIKCRLLMSIENANGWKHDDVHTKIWISNFIHFILYHRYENKKIILTRVGVW